MREELASGPRPAQVVIVGQMEVAIEAKASGQITADHLKGLRHLLADHSQARRIVVCLEPKRRMTEDGIEIVPASVFAAGPGRLLAG